MTPEPSFAQLVMQVLRAAEQPLTLDEIKAQVELSRPVHTRNPRATIRSGISSTPLAVSLGGRPARYAWWPRHLAGNAFRQPLTRADIESGGLALREEIWYALWPDFYAGSTRSSGEVTLALAGSAPLQARVEHLVPGQVIWGLRPMPALAAWYRQQDAVPGDDVIVRVLDVDARRYAVSLVYRADRDNAPMARAIAARNQALIAAAEVVLRASTRSLPVFYLLPRLVAQDAYRDPLPPDPWDDVLRADLRFVVGERDVDLTERVVDYLEGEYGERFDPSAAPRPWQERRIARSEEVRQAWGVYLFDKGMEYIWGKHIFAAEAYYREALRLDPGHADAWVHLGNLRFNEGRVSEALAHYQQGQAAAEARTIGDPARYTGPFWGDIDSRPFMRALHGRGLCLWRLGQIEEARQVFAWMLALNPSDNQGARFLLHDLDEGLSWEESAAKDEGS